MKELQLLKDIDINELITRRYSPKSFSNKEITNNELFSLFEAARLAPSSYNEQPWKFIVGRNGDETFNKITETLSEKNKEWAPKSPVLICGVAKTNLERNDKENFHARYDLGQSVAYLTIQATWRGMFLHQMGGFNKDKMKEKFQLDDNFQPVVVIAVGYLSEEEKNKNSKERKRKSIDDMFFSKDFLVKLLEQ